MALLDVGIGRQPSDSRLHSFMCLTSLQETKTVSPSASSLVHRKSICEAKKEA